MWNRGLTVNPEVDDLGPSPGPKALNRLLVQILHLEPDRLGLLSGSSSSFSASAFPLLTMKSAPPTSQGRHRDD